MSNLSFSLFLKPPSYPPQSYKLRVIIGFVPEGVGNKNHNIIGFIGADLPYWLGLVDNIFNAIYLSPNSKIFTTPVELTISFTGLSFQHPYYPNIFSHNLKIPTWSCYVWKWLEAFQALLQNNMAEFPILKNLGFFDDIEKIKFGRVGRYAFIIHPSISKLDVVEGEKFIKIIVEVNGPEGKFTLSLYVLEEPTSFYDGSVKINLLRKDWNGITHGAILMLKDEKERPIEYPLRPASVWPILTQLLRDPHGLKRWISRIIPSMYSHGGIRKSPDCLKRTKPFSPPIGLDEFAKGGGYTPRMSGRISIPPWGISPQPCRRRDQTSQEAKTPSSSR